MNIEKLVDTAFEVAVRVTMIAVAMALVGSLTGLVR